MNKSQKQLKYHITDSGEEEGARGRGGRERVGGNKVEKVESEYERENKHYLGAPRQCRGASGR